MAIPSADQNRLEEKIRSLCRGADQTHRRAVKEKLGELCHRLEPLARKLEDRPEDAERLVHRLEDLRQTWTACDAREANEIVCTPFSKRRSAWRRTLGDGEGRTRPRLGGLARLTGAVQPGTVLADSRRRRTVDGLSTTLVQGSAFSLSDQLQGKRGADAEHC